MVAVNASVPVTVTSYRIYLFFDVTEGFNPEPGDQLVLKNPDGLTTLVTVTGVGSGAVVVEMNSPGVFAIVEDTVIEPALAGINWEP